MSYKKPVIKKVDKGISISKESKAYCGCAC